MQEDSIEALYQNQDPLVLLLLWDEFSGYRLRRL